MMSFSGVFSPKEFSRSKDRATWPLLTDVNTAGTCRTLSRSFSLWLVWLRLGTGLEKLCGKEVVRAHSPLRHSNTLFL